MLQAEFRRRYGLEPAGREALEVVLAEPFREWRTLAERGAIARVSMEAMFHRIRAMLEQSWAVEVWHIPDGLELLISDSPAITIRYDERLNMQTHVAVGDANCIVMPIARDCLVALGPTSKDDVLLRNQVELFNRLQVGSAYEHVYYRPGSDLRAFVENEFERRESVGMRIGSCSIRLPRLRSVGRRSCSCEHATATSALVPSCQRQGTRSG
jgi:hypothetical protein